MKFEPYTLFGIVSPETPAGVPKAPRMRAAGRPEKTHRMPTVMLFY